jgi:hypothetical protein
MRCGGSGIDDDRLRPYINESTESMIAMVVVGAKHLHERVCTGDGIHANASPLQRGSSWIIVVLGTGMAMNRITR